MKEQASKFGRFLGGKAASGGEVLEKKNIVLNCGSVTPEEAIQTCGRLLLESGCIEESYIRAMLERDKNSSVATGSHMALPHGDSESRKYVKRTGLAVMTCPDGIDWNGEKVRLVIGVASRGEEHLEILRRVAAIAPDEETADKLVDGAAAEELYIKLNGLA